MRVLSPLSCLRDCLHESSEEFRRVRGHAKQYYSPSHEVSGASGCWEPFVDEILARLEARVDRDPDDHDEENYDPTDGSDLPLSMNVMNTYHISPNELPFSGRKINNN
jgi:hypothetical protein